MNGPVAPMTLLAVDDEPAVLSALRRELRRHFAGALRVEVCADPAVALDMVRRRPFDIVLSDLRMPDIDGLALLSLVSALSPRSVLLVLTGSADFETAQRAINEAGVFRYLTKPWTEAALRGHLEAAIACARERARTWGPVDPQAAERARLEALEPGITEVSWGPAGEVLLPPLDAVD